MDKSEYTYTETTVSNRAEFYRQKGFKTSDDTEAFILLSVINPNHTKNIDLIFADNSEEPDFYDLEFGGFCYEMFGCRDEELPQCLSEELQRIVRGEAYIIFASDAKTGRWFFDSIYYDLPDEEMNCMDEFHRALSKIRAPKSFWRKIAGRTDDMQIIRRKHEFNICIDSEALHMVCDEEADAPVEKEVPLSELKNVSDFFVTVRDFIENNS